MSAAAKRTPIPALEDNELLRRLVDKLITDVVERLPLERLADLVAAKLEAAPILADMVAARLRARG